MIYLLSTQTLIDAVPGKPRIMAWLGATSLTDVEISAVSIGQAREAFSRLPSARRRTHDELLDGFVATLEIHDGIIPFDKAGAEIWARLMEMDLPYLRPDGTETKLSATSRMVLATALSRGAILVERKQPYHALIVGLRTISL